MRIVYAIAGEGMGHATRSKVVLDELVKEHDVLVVSSSRAYKYLSEHFNHIMRVEPTRIKYKDNGVARRRTVLCFLRSLPGYVRSLGRLHRRFKTFRPDLVITDLEPLCTYLALFKRIPVVSISNQQVQTRCRADVPGGSLMMALESSIIVRLWAPGARAYLIPSFFYPPIKKGRTFLFPPLIRNEVQAINASKGGHILVYQTSKTDKKLLRILRKITDHEFVIYGFDKDELRGNCAFKKFDSSQFFDDLASARGVIMNGGFSLMSECLYLGKPILSIPVRGQFEQVLNAHYLEKKGLGSSSSETDENVIREFIGGLKPVKALPSRKEVVGNGLLMEKLREVIDDVAAKR